MNTKNPNDSNEQKVENDGNCVYKIQQCDQVIKFRSLNRDHNFIFISNKNSIQVLEPIKLIHIYSFHHDQAIIDFIVSPNDSSLILCTPNSIEIYKLVTSNLSDYQLKIKYEQSKTLQIENIQNITVSNLGDVIACINKHRIIKLFDKNLKMIKTLSFTVQLVPKEIDLFPLNVFQITYDTRNIVLCKYNNNKVSLIYKCRNYSEGENENPTEYIEKSITIKEDIIFMKEYQKSLQMYLDYQDSSLFFVLTKGLNFLIIRKVFEMDPTTYDLIPNALILLYIDLSTQTEALNFPYISFSLIYDNENPIFKGDDKPKDMQSGIVNMDLYYTSTNKNSLSGNENNTFLNYNEYYLKTISSDYIVFNFKENVVMYQINGLLSPPFNNPSIDKIILLSTNTDYDKSYVLLKVTKTFDNIYSMFFIDKYNNIRKFIITGKVNDGTEAIRLSDSGSTFTLFRHIVYAEFNEKNKKTIVYEKQDTDSLIIFINSKLEFSKMIILKNITIDNLQWIKDSNFIIFTYEINDEMVIGIINSYSKYLDKTITFITDKIMHEKFIRIVPSNTLKVKKSISKFIKLFIDSPYIVNDIIEQKEDEKIGYNEIRTEMLIKTKSFISYCELFLTDSNIPDKQSEFSYVLQEKWKFEKKKFNDKHKWEEEEFIFNKDSVYYWEFDKDYKLFNICEINSNGNNRTMFQTVILKDLLYSKIYFNNYLIFISNTYINTYDLSNRAFYRIRNDYIKNNSNDLAIDLFKSGIYLFLILLSNKKITLVRIPKNKNKNEIFSYELKYSFEISKVFSKVSLKNKMIVFNESQLENLSNISKIKHNLLFNPSQQELLLFNSNANSLFDCETFLDFFLSDNEEIIKLILNIFCHLYIAYKDNFKDAYKNSKLLPNLCEINGVESIIKIIFENDLNVLSTIGKEKHYTRKGSINSSEIAISHIVSHEEEKLKFKEEEDNQEKNPINIWCSKSPNLMHMKYIYDLISNEITRNVDNFTKYFILKVKSKADEFHRDIMKMSTADLCWVSLINNQEDVLKFISNEKVTSMTWRMMTLFNIPMWLKSDVKLKELLDHVGRNEFKRLVREEAKNTEDRTQEKNYTEHIALYFYLADKQKLIEEFYDREPQNEKIKKFIKRDFSIAKNRKIAKENADTLMNKKKFIYAAYFYLLADDIRSALDMTLEKLQDLNLTICILRLVNSKYNNDTWKKYYSLEKIYQDFFINFGTVIRDPWLVSYGYIGQKKTDLALEYLLNYDLEYTFEKNRELFENLEEYKSNLKIIEKVFGLSVFDYKILLFAKNLEKIYLSKLKESQNEVKTVENTNFEDLWDMDDDEDDDDEDEKPQQPTKQVSKTSIDIKQINLDYSKLTTECLINSLKRGSLYAPIINLYRLHHNNNFEQLSPSHKELLQSLICDRIVLDTIYSNDQSPEKLFVEVENFFEYIENNHILEKKELYTKVNKGLLFLDEYKSIYISCARSKKMRESLIWLTNYIERLVNNNIYIIANFHFVENVNIDKILGKISKLISVQFFLKKICEFRYNYRHNNNLSQNLPKRNDYITIEINLYICRIIFMIYCYLLFVSKIILKYNLIKQIYDNLTTLLKQHRKIENFDEDKAIDHLNNISEYNFKITKKINNITNKTKKNERDQSLSFFIQFLNLSIIKKLHSLIKENKELSNTISLFSKIKSKYKDELSKAHYIQEDFKFVNFLELLLQTYISNFDINLEKYIKNYMSINLIKRIHEDLMLKYIQQNGEDVKMNEIKTRTIFSRTIKLINFENTFDLQSTIIQYISFLSKQLTYKKIRKGEENEDVNSIDENSPKSNSTYTRESISIVKDIWKDGYEIARFNELIGVQDFTINNCDISSMAISLVDSPHRKVNILYNLLVRSRSENFFELSEPEVESWNEIYKSSFSTNYVNLAKRLKEERYNEILSIIYHDMINVKNIESQFPMKCDLPPELFNDIPIERFAENISLNDSAEIDSRIIESHPQLPYYLTTNSKGLISLWSYQYNSDRSIDEYYIEKLSKGTELPKYNEKLTRLKFNHYGNEFLACNQSGDLFLWEFEHIKGLKIPKIVLKSQDFSSCKDACFLNNSGILVSTSNKKGERQKSILWDFLLPLKKSNVGEVELGGNFIVPISSDSSFAVVNERPGYISFIDIRKMEVVKSFQAHNEEIKSIKLSEREKFLVTFGKDSIIKIWDLTQKVEPLLVEEIQPFPSSHKDKKSRFKLEISQGFLFASKDNCIKMLRNKIL